MVRGKGYLSAKAHMLSHGAQRSLQRTLPILLALSSPLLVSAQPVDGNLADRLLAAHNRERAAMDLPGLRWNNRLAADAARWAGQLATRKVLQHENGAAGSGQGENLWIGTANRFTPETMVGAWVAEKTHFVAGAFPHVSRTGRRHDVAHYTQVIWRDTTDVGCAIASGQEYDVLVCRYREVGNVAGQSPL